MIGNSRHVALVGIIKETQLTKSLIVDKIFTLMKPLVQKGKDFYAFFFFFMHEKKKYKYTFIKKFCFFVFKLFASVIQGCDR